MCILIIDDGGLGIEKKQGEMEIINLDFSARIKAYPRKENRKEKGVVLV